MHIDYDVYFCFHDQDREKVIPNLLVHISYHPLGKMPVYFRPRLSDTKGCILLKKDDIVRRVDAAESENSLFFCDLPDTRKTERFEVRVLNHTELWEDYEMKKLFSNEISESLRIQIEQCCNKAYLGRKLICEVEPEISIYLTQGF